MSTVYDIITTTITTTVNLTTFESEHRVVVEAEESVLPQDAIVAAVRGGLKSALAALGEGA